MKKLIIIDGYSFLFRAYYATKNNNNNLIRTKSNIPTNAIYIFAYMINKILDNLKENEYIFVGFDSITPSFRKKQFAQYKANRIPCPQELKIQMPIAHEFLDAISIKHYEKEGFEGDDICGSVAKMANDNNFDVTIYTSDHDFFQLINQHTTVKIIKKGIDSAKEINNENIKILFGIKANQLVDYKGLKGDESDNIPGIPGIGDKIAKKLLNKYKNYEDIVEHLQEIKEINNTTKEKIKKYFSQGQLSKELATIKTDIILPFDINELKYNGYNFEKMKQFCQKYELFNLLNFLSNKLKKYNFEKYFDFNY